MASGNMTFIYALSDPDTGLVRYIGKSNEPLRRYRRHLKNAQEGQTFHCPTWIRSLLAIGKTPVLTTIESCSIEVWKERERHWISDYRAKGFDLTNCKDGGDGHLPNEETRLKMRLAKLGKQPHNKGKKTPDGVRLKQSAAAKARVARNPEAVRANMIKAQLIAVTKTKGVPGRRKSADEIELIRESLLGNTHSKGKELSDGARKKISRQLMGHPTSEETKRKIGEANKKRAAERAALKK